MLNFIEVEFLDRTGWDTVTFRKKKKKKGAALKCLKQSEAHLKDCNIHPTGTNSQLNSFVILSISVVPRARRQFQFSIYSWSTQRKKR